MKYLKQLTIILAVSFAGEVLKFILPFPVPASIYGLVIMFILLATGLLKLEAVEKTADFLLEIMSVMFVPSAVGLITVWGELQQMILPAIRAIVCVTAFVIGVTGKVTQAIIERGTK